MKAWEFHKSLKARGMSLTKLAPLLMTTHSHLSQVVNGTRGGLTRRKMAKFLTKEETEILGWDEQGSFVPRANMLPVEHTAEEVAAMDVGK